MQADPPSSLRHFLALFVHIALAGKQRGAHDYEIKKQGGHMSAWDVNLYLQFGNERTQPAIDLLSRVNINKPERIIDLGCGPGNSTEILRQRWPNAHAAGLDSSLEMISAARKS